jgi:hypothetical protein
LLLQFAQQRLHKSPARLSFEEIDAPLIAAFLDNLEKGRGITIRSRSLRLTAIRSFFQYAACEEPSHAAQIQCLLAMPYKHQTRALVHFLSRPEIDALLAAPNQETWFGRRDYALKLAAVQTGLRLSELTSLQRHVVAYLLWDTWTQAMLPGLIPAYLPHLPEITSASDERSRRFASHLAGFAVFGAIDPVDNGWLVEFLTRSQHRERMHWVGSVTQILREANDQSKESTWDRWMERYLRLRVTGNPVALDAEESGAMCEWAIALESHYAEILELLLAGPPPDVKGDMFYYRLQEAGLLDSAPALTARFLTALLSHEDGHDFWDLDQVHTMISQLIDHDPTEPALRPLCEQLGRIGSPRALEFQVGCGHDALNLICVLNPIHRGNPIDDGKSVLRRMMAVAHRHGDLPRTRLWHLDWPNVAASEIGCTTQTFLYNISGEDMAQRRKYRTYRKSTNPLTPISIGI